MVTYSECYWDTGQHCVRGKSSITGNWVNLTYRLSYGCPGRVIGAWDYYRTQLYGRMSRGDLRSMSTTTIVVQHVYCGTEMFKGWQNRVVVMIGTPEAIAYIDAMLTELRLLSSDCDQEALDIVDRYFQNGGDFTIVPPIPTPPPPELLYTTPTYQIEAEEVVDLLFTTPTYQIEAVEEPAELLFTTPTYQIEGTEEVRLLFTTDTYQIEGTEEVGLLHATHVFQIKGLSLKYCLLPRISYGEKTPRMEEQTPIPRAECIKEYMEAKIRAKKP